RTAKRRGHARSVGRREANRPGENGWLACCSIRRRRPNTKPRWPWYQARTVRAAARFEVEVDRVLGLIKDSPESYPRYDDDHRFAILRRYPYSLVYQARPGQVFIVAVAHSSRSAGYWRGRTGTE